MPCGSCHGANGRGKSEGGVTPARIDWETLTRNLDDGDRHRPPYTEALLRRAITLGIDSGAKKLQSVMPRYRLRRDDIDDLVAYLKKLGNIEKLAPDIIAAGNIGCITQIASGTATPVLHVVELIDWATGGPCPKPLEKLKDKVHPIQSLMELAGAR